MLTPVQRTMAFLAAWRATLADRITADDRGEGVVSMALAIMIVAFLGVAAWVLFKGVLAGTGQKTTDQISQIGG
jgi:hypothetical protein